MEEEFQLKQFQVASSTGIYYAARDESLATTLRKVGYILTRGVNATEIALDVAHEIQYTESKEIRYLANKQGITLLLHGSLTIPFEIPEISDYAQAQNHARLSLKSGIFIGAKYVLFHSCLHFWPELITYTSHKLEIIPCSPDGLFISFLLNKDEKLRKWFIERYGYKENWAGYILPRERILIYDEKQRAKIIRILEELGRRKNIDLGNLERIRHSPNPAELGTTLLAELVARGVLTEQEYKEEIKKIENANKEAIKETLEEFLSSNEHFKWRMKERLARLWDTFNIIAHYVWFNRERNYIWQELTKLSRYNSLIKKLLNEYEQNGKKEQSFLEYVWENYVEAGKAEAEVFKEFFYALVAGQMLLGHLENLVKWLEGKEKESIQKIIEEEVRSVEKDEEIARKEIEELKKNAENVMITVEVPDSRSPEYAGRYNLWRPSQILAVVKAARKYLEEKGYTHANKIFMTIDFEHIATHGVDPWEELNMFVKDHPDAGKYILSIHSNYPNPLHPHLPLEFGDINYYKLFWILRQAGLGKYHKVYLIFERGGGQDPFKKSIMVLKTVARMLEKDIPPEKLPPEFFGLSSREIGAIERQMAIIKEHAFDPLQGMLVVPEEKHTFLGKAAVEKGKAEVWKKEELR
ncbi:MAG: hypothetical protein B6U78_00590 [Candidatus Aenigmarchaeota archaeon ex4484_224]|nr:MAG: hypothetical protein B6U78_00590 [Candidatus Aenigmarchaeota archaeon ex4484_224]